MMKPLFTLLCALVLAGCATWNYPLEEAEEGVYYADSPPDYVYVDYGHSWSSMYAWIGPPYRYPMTFYSPYLYLGHRGYYPSFGMADYRAMNLYGWHGPAPLTPYRHPYYGAAYGHKGVVTPGRRKPVNGGYAKAYSPQLRVKSDAPRRPEPKFAPSMQPPARSSAAAPVRRMSAPSASRPARSMRAAPSSRSTSRNIRRDLD